MGGLARQPKPMERRWMGDISYHHRVSIFLSLFGALEWWMKEEYLLQSWAAKTPEIWFRMQPHKSRLVQVCISPYMAVGQRFRWMRFPSLPKGEEGNRQWRFFSGARDHGVEKVDHHHHHHHQQTPATGYYGSWLLGLASQSVNVWLGSMIIITTFYFSFFLRQTLNTNALSSPNITGFITISSQMQMSHYQACFVFFLQVFFPLVSLLFFQPIFSLPNSSCLLLFFFLFKRW